MIMSLKKFNLLYVLKGTPHIKDASNYVSFLLILNSFNVMNTKRKSAVMAPIF